MRGLAGMIVFVGSFSLVLAQSGTVKSEGQPLPGATVRATQGDRILTTLTDAKGDFKLANMAPGAWTIDVAMFGFTPQMREVQITASPAKIDFTLQIGTFAANGRRGGFGGGFGGERRFEGAAQGAGGLGGPGGQNGAGTRSGFNREATATPPANPDVGETAQAAAPDTVPPAVDVAALQQANAGGANESFLVNGSLSTGLQTQASDFTPGGLSPYGGAFGSGVAPAAVSGAAAVAGQDSAASAGTAGAPAGPPGGFGGRGFGGGGFGGPGGRGFGGPGGPRPPRGPGGRGGFIGNRRNAGQRQIRGSIYYSLRNSALDASPFSLNGQTNTKAAYAQNRVGFNLGGPLEIPKLFHSENTFFFINYNGNLARNGMNLISTVPTLAERAGDFSGLSTVIYNPATGMPFAANRITQISPIAQALLNYIPVPNQPGTVNNYRLIAAVPNNNQNLNARVNQTFSRRDQISVGVNWQARDLNNLQNYGFTDQSSGNGINANINYRHTFGTSVFQNFTGTFNRNTSVTTPFFANGADVAATLGIQGTSSNPINFGPPTLSFTNFGALTDGAPTQSAIYNYGFTEAFSIRRGKHNWTLGGGYNRYFRNTITDSNGRGTFNFTGLATSQLNANGQALPGTGLDFADFLLGLPQSDSIRFGSSNTYFRTNAFNFFGQDDFRVRNNLTLNLGLRYEYFAPWQEKYGRIANLDIAPGFTAVSVVTPSQPGVYSGAFPAGLINPDRNNFAPRTALAWKPWNRKNPVVRIGYGIYYNPGTYDQFTSRLSAQPPFAQSTTVNTSLLNPLTLATGLTVTPSGKTILNTFAVDRNYRTMYAQAWNIGFQSELPGALLGELNYLWTKGTHLDIQEMPNQAPPGSVLTSEQRLAIGNATGFIYDTPAGNSIYHALQTRLTRRFRHGFSTNILYTFAKSIDNSSTLGGAGNTVAQNFFDLAAERGLSSFDRRHSLAVNYVIQSPVGSNGVLANNKLLETALKDWTLAGSVTLQTGTPLTARVLGNQSDIAGTGTIGSGRADATGLPANSGSGFFNLLAFTTPPAGQYGDAGRNTITGPGTFSTNLSLQRVITLHERMRLQIRVDANNLTNHVNITSIGTVVNSLTYGAPLTAGSMRSLSATIRFNF